MEYRIVLIEECIFEKNTAGVVGGAFLVEQTSDKFHNTTILNCIFKDNYAFWGAQFNNKFTSKGY